VFHGLAALEPARSLLQGEAIGHLPPVQSRKPHLAQRIRLAGQFVEKFDDAGARAGYCLYKVGCKGPTTYNACSTTRWNERVSFPIESGHGCIGSSEEDFWDKGSFYDRVVDIQPGIELNADRIGGTLAVATGAAIAAHAAVTAIKRARDTKGEGHSKKGEA
jgi:hydrogenase small subunit